MDIVSSVGDNVGGIFGNGFNGIGNEFSAVFAALQQLERTEFGAAVGAVLQIITGLFGGIGNSLCIPPGGFLIIKRKRENENIFVVWEESEEEATCVAVEK